MTHSPSPWWDRDRHRDRRPRLVLRNRIVAAIRGWFAAEGFVEVEPAALQTSPGNEVHLHGFQTRIEASDGRVAPLYLHTSPEFAMKKLLAAGETQIFALSQVFRNRERTALHAPAFTMLEWYRAEAPYEAVMADSAAIVALAARTAEAASLSWRSVTVDPAAPPEQLTVGDAFLRHAGIDLLATIPGEGEPDRDALATMAGAAGIRVAPDDGWMDVFSRVLAERVEPVLGRGRATLLMEYPAPAAALARPKPGDDRVAERFELFACGVELANGFGELTDAAEQRRRFEAEMEEKERLYGRRVPIDEDFLAALSAMPPASGVALGLDRLVMLATGAERVEDVQWTPVVDPFR